MPVTPQVELSGVAEGGTVTLVEQSALGRCRVSITTASGESAATVAARLRDAFGSQPASSPWCLSRQNPRDAMIDGSGALRLGASTGLTVQNTDGGLTYTLGGDS